MNERFIRKSACAVSEKLHKLRRASYFHTVNNLGQRTAVTTTGEPFAQSPADWTWNYDALGQLTQANAHQYTYDQIGNRRTSGKNNETLTTYCLPVL